MMYAHMAHEIEIIKCGENEAKRILTAMTCESSAQQTHNTKRHNYLASLHNTLYIVNIMRQCTSTHAYANFLLG